MPNPLIMVIDHEPVFLEMMHAFLADIGYEVIPWMDGAGAFETIVRERPDLVILDTWLEHRNAGEMVLSLMRIDPATRRVPIIVCASDHRFRTENPVLLGDHQCNVLPKPFTLDVLRATIEANTCAASAAQPSVQAGAM